MVRLEKEAEKLIANLEVGGEELQAKKDGLFLKIQELDLLKEKAKAQAYGDNF